MGWLTDFTRNLAVLFYYELMSVGAEGVGFYGFRGSEKD